MPLTEELLYVNPIPSRSIRFGQQIKQADRVSPLLIAIAHASTDKGISQPRTVLSLIIISLWTDWNMVVYSRTKQLVTEQNNILFQR